MMKIDTRAATKIFAQECLELIMDWFKIRTFADEEIDMKETIQIGNMQKNNINHDNSSNNKANEINNATNSRQNNQNENQEKLFWNDVASTQFANELNNTYQKIFH